jgi:outer membrane immunogenic protein
VLQARCCNDKWNSFIRAGLGARQRWLYAYFCPQNQKFNVVACAGSPNRPTYGRCHRSELIYRGRQGVGFMKAIAGLVGATLLFAGSAVEASPWAVEVSPLVPEFTWTGCYGGLGIGGAWAHQTVATSGSVVENQAPVSGALGGSYGIVTAYGGCNWQFASAWLLGVEGEYSWTQIKDISTAPNLFLNGAPVGSGGINWSHNLDRIGSVRGRLGYIVKPNILLFVASGIAWEHSSFAGLDAGIGGCPNCRTTSVDQIQDGFVVGGGMDWAPWGGDWIVRLEYLHYQFPGVASLVSFAPGNSITFRWGNESVDSVRAGVAYRF